MNSNQQKYITYAEAFAKMRNVHIWLGGSFLHGTSTPFSDVDISVLCEEEVLRDLIYGYGEPVYISSTANPPGILIVIYEDGVALDLEVLESVDASSEGFFHRERIKEHAYTRNETVCQKFALRSDSPYQMARLFHRSLIKFLAGKRDLGVSVANEIEDYLLKDATITEENYKDGIVSLLKQFGEQYPLPEKYHMIIQELTEELGK